MPQYVLAHDVGTSGDKAVLYSLEGRPVAEHTCHYPCRYPFPGAAEQDPGDWWRAFCGSSRALMEESGIRPEEVAAVSFSAQMNCCLPVDARGQALRPAIIWADQRAEAQARELTDALGEDALYRLTGHRVSAGYAGAKMMWLRQQEPALYARTAKFLQPKDYLACQLTGRMSTDYSDASHLALMDQKSRAWSAPILEATGLDEDKLPQLLPSTAVQGRVSGQAAKQCGLLAGTPVVAGGGDGSCATAGAGVCRPGEAYNSLGTSSWIGMLSEEPYIDPGKRCFNLLHLDGRLHLALGTTQAAGFSLQWIMETLYGKENAAQGFERLADTVAPVPPGSGGLIFLPYLMGERSPWWNPQARGCFIGLGAEHGRPEMLNAVMEGVGLNLRLILDSLMAGAPVRSLRLIGGGGRSAVWLQMLADIWQTEIRVPRLLEYAASAGAALCAGVGIGAFPDLSAAERLNPIDRVIVPRRELADSYQPLLERFTAVYKALEPVAFAGEIKR